MGLVPKGGSMKPFGKIMDWLFVVASLILGVICFILSFKYFHQDLFIVFITCAYVNIDNMTETLRKL